MKRLAAVFTLIASAALIGGVSQLTAAEAVRLSKKQVKELIVNAKTPADHLRLAAYFNGQADKLQAEARDHEDLAAIYQSHPAVLGSKSSVPISGGVSHCSNIAKSLRDAAKADQELAAEHEQMAKAAEK